jgi:hypothetical protein
VKRVQRDVKLPLSPPQPREQSERTRRRSLERRAPPQPPSQHPVRSSTCASERMCERAHVRRRRRQANEQRQQLQQLGLRARFAWPPSSPLACPCLPQKSSGYSCNSKCPSRSIRSAHDSVRSCRSRRLLTPVVGVPLPSSSFALASLASLASLAALASLA